MPKNPKVAGQIVSADGERVVLVGETLDEVLDLATWELVGVGMRPKELRAFDADGPLTQGSSLGRTANDAGLLRHGSCVL